MLPTGARRVSVPAVRLSRWLDGFADRHGSLDVEATSETVHITGATDGAQAWLEVPFPPLDVSGPPLTGLQVHVARTRRIGVLLVRRGGFAAGVFEGAKLVSSKVDSAYVQGGTKAGGWSQQRYARRRANQASAAFGEAADIAVRILVPVVDELDAVVVGGDRPAVGAVLADPRLAAVAGRVTGPFLAVGDPRKAVLEATPEQFLAVRVSLVP